MSVLKKGFFATFIFLNFSLNFFGSYLYSKEENIKSFDYELYEILNNKKDGDLDTYLLGAGDTLKLKFENAKEFSNNYTIDPNGRIDLPRLESVLIEGLTCKEMESLLEKKYSNYIFQPQISISIADYRPVNVYVSGEVDSPGFYNLSSNNELDRFSTKENLFNTENQFEDLNSLNLTNNSLSTSSRSFPTLFDAIKRARGITPFSDLTKIKVIRKETFSQGGGLIEANLDLLDLLTKGDETQNIRLYDGDVIVIKKSDSLIQDQIMTAARTNLNPKFFNVFVTGRVNEPGTIKVPQGATLNQAIILAGGAKVLKGKIEFLRFKEGKIERRLISHKPSEKSYGKSNPILMNGDIVRVRNSPISGSVEVLNELTLPILGVYSIYNIFSN